MKNSRFLRTALLFSDENFKKIENVHVLIVGLGGVGYMAAESLVRSGIMNMTIVDCDIIEESDFNRHLLGIEENISKEKVSCAKERLLKINPSLNINTINRFFHVDTQNDIFTIRPDFVIDAIDALNPKVELIKFCITNRIPFISTMGAARRKDPLCVRISRLNEATGCPLVRLVKKKLRRDGFYEDFSIVYSDEKMEATPVKEIKDMYFTRGRKRDILPSYMVVPSVFGLYAAYATLNFLTKGRIL